MTKTNNLLLTLLSAGGLMALTSCADDKYDLSDIDMTIGIGSSDGLTLPTSSTKLIKLEDMLELGDDESVIIEENGDYVFVQDGGEVDDVTTEINRIAIVESEDNPSEEYPVEIDIPGLPPAGSTVPETMTISIPAGEIDEELYTIRYEGEKPTEVVDLKNVNTEGTFNVKIDFSEAVQRFIPSFLTFQIEFPSYMKVKVTNWNSYDGKETGDHTLLINNVPTNKTLEVGVAIEALKFIEGSNDFLRIDGDMINMEGVVKVNVKWNKGQDITIKAGETIRPLELINRMRIEDCYIVSATGLFNPDIEIQELGSTTVGELPDFLTNEDVVLDLDNPQIKINIDSDLPVPGFLEGRLTTTDENGNPATDAKGNPITLNTGKIPMHGGSNSIVLCKRKGTESGVTYVEKPEELSSIIENITKINELAFTAEAHANATVESMVELGKEYLVKPSYRIEAPLAFGERASIAYKDTLNGWNEDLQDLEFQDGAYLQVTTDIENKIPAYLDIDAYAIGVDGERVADATVEIDKKTIAAYIPGTEPKSTPFNITIKSKNTLEKVDGIVISIKVAAAANGQPAVTGVALNAYEHGLTLRNIKATVKGKVIIKDED